MASARLQNDRQFSEIRAGSFDPVGPSGGNRVIACLQRIVPVAAVEPPAELSADPIGLVQHVADIRPILHHQNARQGGRGSTSCAVGGRMLGDRSDDGFVGRRARRTCGPALPALRTGPRPASCRKCRRRRARALGSNRTMKPTRRCTRERNSTMSRERSRRRKPSSRRPPSRQSRRHRQARPHARPTCRHQFRSRARPSSPWRYLPIDWR